MVKHLHQYEDRLAAARELEKKGDPDAAAKAYLDIIAELPSVYGAYNRLLIIYRKQKAYRKELKTVNSAIKAFESQQTADRKQWMKEHRVAAKLSKALAIKLGMLQKNGLPVHKDPMVEQWLKRKAVIEKKLKQPAS